MMSSGPAMTGKILALTGATGFVGAAIAERFATAGVKVRALARTPENLDENHIFESVAGDLADEHALGKLCEGADWIVHCAGLTHARNDAEFARTNVTGAANVAHAFCQNGAQSGRMVHISSLAARRPAISAYAGSKFDSEGAVQAVMEGGREQSLVTMRAPALFGPRDHATLPFFKAVKAGLAPIPGGKVEGRVSIICVDDFVDAIEVALSADTPPGLYEIGDSKPGGHSWREIVTACATGLGVRARALPLPKPVLSGYAALSSSAIRLAGRAPMVTPQKIEEFFYPDWAARENLFSQSTAWTPRTSIEEGFAKTAKWYQQAGWL